MTRCGHPHPALDCGACAPLRRLDRRHLGRHAQRPARLRGGRRGLPQVPRRRRPGRAPLQRAAAFHRRGRPHGLARRRPRRLRHRRHLGRCDAGTDRGLGRPAAAAYRPGARPRAVRGPRCPDGPGRGRGGDRLLRPLRRHQGDARRLCSAVRSSRRPRPADDLRQSGPGGGARRHPRLLRRLARRGLCRQGREGHLCRQAAPADLRAHLCRDRPPRPAGPCRRRAFSPSATASTPTLPARTRRACDSVFIASAVHLPGELDARTLAELFASRPFAPIAACLASHRSRCLADSHAGSARPTPPARSCRCGRSSPAAGARRRPWQAGRSSPSPP